MIKDGPDYYSTIAAIVAINPAAQVTVRTPIEGGEGEETIEWLKDTPEISKADIDAKKIELEAEWIAQEYARERADEYPSKGDQMDMIYKDNLNSTTTHKDAVESVKTKWPKDNSGPV